MVQGVVVFQGKINGVVTFTQLHRLGVQIDIDLDRLSPGFHGLHIHRTGDLRKGCESCCEHYDIYGNDHGDIDDENSHTGDLGNIEADENGEVHMQLFTKKFKVKDIIGRSLIVHEDEDDLGRGRNKSSKINGNSGSRLACAIIGIAE